MSLRPALAIILRATQTIAPRPWVPPLVLALVGAVAAQSWFRSGTMIASGDNLPAGFLDPDQSLREARWLWGSATTSTGGPDYYPALETLPALVGKAFSVVGLGPEIAQRGFLTLLFAGLAPAMFLFLRCVLSERRHLPAVVLGSLFYAFNPALFFVIPNAVILCGLVLLPLLPALILRSWRHGGWHYPALLALATLPVSYTFQNPPTVALVLAAALVAAVGVIARGPRRAGTFLLRTSLLVLLVNAWWLVPVGVTLLGPSGAAVTADADPTAWRWTHEHSSLENVFRLVPAWSWPKPEYFPYAATLERAPFVLLAFLPALATLAAAFFGGGRRRVALVVAGLALVLAFLAKGLHPPFAGANEALYRYVPGMWLFREPAAKFTLVLAALFAIGIALLVSSLERPWLRRVTIGAFGLAIGVVSHPIWLGDVVPESRPLLPAAHARIPGYWQEAAGYINRRPGTTLLLPPDDYYQMPYRWGFYGADVLADELVESRVIRLLDPRGSAYLEPDPSAERVLAALREAVETSGLERAAGLMRVLGVRWVLLRRDIDHTFPDRTIEDPVQLAGELARRVEFRRVRTFGELDLYELVGAPATPVWASSTALQPRASSAAEAPFDLPLAQLPTLLSSPTPWLPSRTVEVIGSGEWRATQGGWVASVTRDRRRPTVFARWPKGFPISVERLRSGFVRVRPAPGVFFAATIFSPFPPVSLPVGDDRRQLLLDVNGRSLELSERPGIVPSPGLLVHPGRNVISLRARLRGTALADPSFETGTWGPVGDCHARDPRGLAELGIRAERVAGGTHGRFALALSAREHSACVSQPLRGFHSGGSYRFSLDYLHLEGASPRLCVWQEGPERCLRLPELPVGKGWQRVDYTLEPERGTTSLRLFLYADGDGKGTRVRYDDVRLYQYRTVATRRLRVDGAWQRVETVSLEGGKVSLAGVPEQGDPFLADPSFETGTWGPVGDCHARDPRGLAELGIRAERVAGGTHGRFALALSAREHSACVSQPLRGFHSGGSYRFSLDYLHLEGASPRLCVWQEGPERCLRLPELPVGKGWQRVDYTLEPERGTTSLRLFLYADGDGKGTRVRYDDVRLKRLDPLPEVALLGPATARARQQPQLTLVRSSPGGYRILTHGGRGPFLLALNQTFNSRWRLEGAPVFEHVRVNWFANGWIVDGRGDPVLTLRYEPQRWVDYARLASLLGLGLVAFCLLSALPGWLVLRRREPVLAAGRGE